MRKTLCTGLACLTMLFVAAGEGQALSFMDVYDAGHAFLRGSLFGAYDGISRAFDTMESRFEPLVQDIVAADATLGPEDDNGWFDLHEGASLDLGGILSVREVGTGEASLLLTSLKPSSETGRVKRALQALGGGSFLHAATLRATASPVEATFPPAAIVPGTPEPSTMLLFGVGLIVLAFFGKKIM